MPTDTATHRYHDSDGNPCSLETLCMRDPMWAATRIQVLLAENHSIQRALSIELGDPMQAPKGWEYSFKMDTSEPPGIWPEIRWSRDSATVWRGPTAFGKPDGWVWWWAIGETEGTEAKTALEGMEAADALLMAVTL